MSNPADLNVVPQPDTDKNYFNFKATNLKINETYAIKFQWAYSDGTLSDWSPGYFITTSNEAVPGVPTGTIVPSTFAGSIPVDLPTFPTGARKVDVIITNGIFGLGKVAYTFFAAGKTTIAAPAGTYIVQLRSTSVSGVTSTVGTTHTILVTDPAANLVADPSVTPSTPTVSSVLGAIQLSWNGKTASGSDQPNGFVAAKVYVGTTSNFTPVDTGISGANQVDVLNFGNGQNTLNIAVGTLVNGVALTYNTDYFVKIKTTNGNTAEDSAAVLATGSPAQIGKAGSGDIISITADQITTGTISSQVVTVGSSSGKHVKLSGTGDPLTVYGTGGVSDPLLSFSTNGGQSVLSIKGSGTFTGSLTGASGTFGPVSIGSTGISSTNFSIANDGTATFNGTVTANSGSIGNWQINSGVLKSGTEAFPRVLLDPTNSQIVLRESNGASDTGNIIKIDPSLGIRVGTTTLPKFTVDMSGNLSATDAIFTSGTFNGNITSSATITGGTLTGSRVQTATDSYYGSIRMGYTEGFGTGSTLEVVGANGVVSGQLYQFNNGNELILRHGSSREVGGYPTSSAYITLNPYTLAIGFTNSSGALLRGLSLESTAGGSSFTNARFENMAVSSIGANSSGTSVADTGRYFRNTVINNTSPSGSGFAIGDIWIQY